GVERAFPYHSPLVEKVEVARVGRVRRARLYYLRDRVGKAARIKPGARARFEALTAPRSEEHTSELQSRVDLVCRLLLEKKNMQRAAEDVHAGLLVALGLDFVECLDLVEESDHTTPDNDLLHPLAPSREPAPASTDEHTH